MIKNLVVTFAAGIGLTLSASLVAFGAPVVSVEPQLTSVLPGDIVSLDVRASDLGDLFAFEFDVGFSPAILSALSITEGAFLSGAGSTLFVPGSIENATGRISLTTGTLIGPGPGAIGSGVLATLQFRALSSGSGAIQLSNVLLLNSAVEDIDAEVQAGRVAVVPEPCSFALLVLGGLALLLMRRTKPARTAS
ncbi:MAG: cohesin domain-containing protein [Bryobacteraceae bacterium]